MRIRIYPQRKKILSVGAICIVGFLIFVVLDAPSAVASTEIVSWALAFAALLMFFALGTHLAIEDEWLVSTRGFFFKKRARLGDIKFVYTGKMNLLIPIPTIFFEYLSTSGVARRIAINIDLYDKSALVELVRQIKKDAPRAEVEEKLLERT